MITAIIGKTGSEVQWPPPPRYPNFKASNLDQLSEGELRRVADFIISWIQTSIPSQWCFIASLYLEEIMKSRALFILLFWEWDRIDYEFLRLKAIKERCDGILLMKCLSPSWVGQQYNFDNLNEIMELAQIRVTRKDN